MTITPTALSRSAGVAAILAGLTFIGVQIGHPHLDVTSVGTVEWTVRNTAKAVFATLGLAGITGIYLRQVKQMGVLGLIGYLVLGAGYLALLSVQMIGVFVLPDLAAIQPGYVNDVLAVATSGTPVGDVGRMETLSQVAVTYIIGGVIFGIALFRAGILARWAAALMSVGAVATVATFQLPELTQRLFAIPVGVALIGLGYSLWREQRTVSHRSLPSSASSQLDPAEAR